MPIIKEISIEKEIPDICSKPDVMTNVDAGERGRKKRKHWKGTKEEKIEAAK